MTRSAFRSLQRAVVAGVVFGVLTACSAGTGQKSGLFTTIIPKRPAPERQVAALEVPPPSTEGSAVAADAARDQIVDASVAGYDAIGMASWYGRDFHGRPTANGEIFDKSDLTAAHPSLPLPSYVRVTNLENDRSIILRVNDRGPYSHNRLIDVSEQAAELLAFRHSGSTRVRVQYVSPAPRNAEDAAALLASYHGPSLPAADAVAFAQPDQLPVMGAGAVAALRRLTQSASADDRIQIAFRVADPPAQ